MKKIITLMLSAVLIVGMMFTLVSCGNKLSGLYEGTLIDLEFSGSKVVASLGDEKLEGTYKIEKDDDGKKTISFDFVDTSEESSSLEKAIDDLLKGKLPFSESEDGKTITIGSGVLAPKFTKK